MLANSLIFVEDLNFWGIRKHDLLFFSSDKKNNVEQGMHGRFHCEI